MVGDLLRAAAALDDHLLATAKVLTDTEKVVIPAFEHEYRHGFQHIVPKNEVYFRWGGGTVVVWLQNAAGFARWGPTEDRVEALLDAWRPRAKRPDAEPAPAANTTLDKR